MDLPQTTMFNPGDVINQLYEVREVLEATDATITYRVHHRRRDIEAKLTVLRSGFGSSSPEFQAFMTRIHDERQCNPDVVDFGILMEGLVPYIVHASTNAG